MASFMVVKVAISRKNIEIWRVLWGGDKKKKRDCASSWWAKMDSNHRRRKPADLQSAPFAHSGICPLPYQRCKVRNYFFNFKIKFTIFTAHSANSSPLLPRQPPARSRACSSFSTVSTPNTTGTSVVALSVATPLVTLSHT